MKSKATHIRELEKIVERFLQPVKGIPFCIAVKALYGQRVRQIDIKSKEDRILIDLLVKGAELAGKRAKKEGVFRSRPNEVGNDMEIYVRESLKSLGIPAQVPQTRKGKKRAAGYPDIYFQDKHGRHTYLEIKTYNRANINTTQRSFYFSPSPKGTSKVIYDAFHLVLSFEIKETKKRKRRCYIPTGWKLLTINNLPVDVKYEFNSTNRRLYEKSNILREGRI